MSSASGPAAPAASRVRGSDPNSEVGRGLTAHLPYEKYLLADVFVATARWACTFIDRKRDLTSVTTDLARQYRARAQETRAMAAAAITDEGRQNLLQIADTWERMADWEDHQPAAQQVGEPERRPPPKSYA